MPIYSRQEFADMCGLEPKNLNTYIGRKKVVLTNNTVDTSKKINKEFLETRIKKADPAKPIVKKDIHIEYEREVAPFKKDFNETPKQKQENRSSVQQGSDDDSFFELEKEKKALDIEKIREDIELLKLKKDKLHGIVIPTELVKSLFSQHTKSILVEFKNSVEKIITKIAKKKSLSNNEVAALRKELNSEINIAVDKAIDESKKGIKSIVSTFAESKSIGEKA